MLVVIGWLAMAVGAVIAKAKAAKNGFFFLGLFCR